ncbi:MAG: hypothetical protein LBU60_04145 [Clostridiales bacterium]|nr:hypothetical protein [Clostridiales bacterium]
MDYPVINIHIDELISFGYLTPFEKQRIFTLSPRGKIYIDRLKENLIEKERQDKRNLVNDKIAKSSRFWAILSFISATILGIVSIAIAICK